MANSGKSRNRQLRDFEGLLRDFEGPRAGRSLSRRKEHLDWRAATCVGGARTMAKAEAEAGGARADGDCSGRGVAF